MPCCAASHCCNREIGVRLFRFPKDTTRKEIWRIFCERGEWQPTKNHKLCEVHFAEDQFETQALTTKGNRKLKPAAIPTIYVEQPIVDPQTIKQMRRAKKKINKPGLPRAKKIKTEVGSPKLDFESPKLDCETSTTDLTNIISQPKRKHYVLMLPNGPNNMKMGIVIKGPKDLEKIKQIYGDKPLPPVKHLKMKTHMFNQINKQVCAKTLKLSDLTSQTELETLNLDGIARTIGKQPKASRQQIDRLKTIYEQKMKLLMVQNNYLRKKLAKTNLRLYMQKKCLSQIFSQDQMDVLASNYKRPTRWSDETIHRCQQLRYACGRKGYKHLVSMGYPLPTVAALLMKPTDKLPSLSDVSHLNEGLVECNVEITVENENE